MPGMLARAPERTLTNKRIAHIAEFLAEQFFNLFQRFERMVF